ncbi:MULTISPECIES: ABC transporter permease [Streptomyces]|uniref:ABC-2 type transport system permease protein n=1 Tax=Streptomyces radiopugnans TaxID=403935 RepID=A0A1H9ERA8_9ACTN|nr:ABC transporter permease [Streptomyces radiopugnans]SEQ27723.1 ABC-2 type transport system permease protein [Streptomyces radiopugnans]
MNGLALRHMRTLFRIEWKLFNRIRANYVFAVAVPLMLLVAMRSVQEQMDLAAHGVDAGPLMVSTSAGILLIFTLYSSVTGLYVARREELVLKRLRTGEVSDPVILAGGASMYVALTVAQIAVVAVVLSVMFGAAPRQPLSAVAGLVTGVALMTAMAAATAALCRSVESVMVATLPAIFVLPLASGVYIPREVLPDALGDVLVYAPLSPTVDLIRSGWTGQLSAAEVPARIVLDAVWAALFAWVAFRRFRWEPRT